MNERMREKLHLNYDPIRFHRIGNAEGFIEKCENPHRIILGDDGLFWIVCPADAERLFHAGYEYAI